MCLTRWQINCRFPQRLTLFDFLSLIICIAGNALLKVGQTQQKLGQCEKDFTTKTTRDYLVPLKSFLDGDMKTIAVSIYSLQSRSMSAFY